MRRSAYLVIVVALTASVIFIALVEPAAAKVSDVGENVGKEVRSWASALLLGTATLVGLPAVAKREVNEGMKIALLVAVLGGFIFASGTVKQAIDSIWSSIA
jgi:hypothetical protein